MKNTGKPYPNGRNEESSSESIFAYEAVALYGEVMSTAFEGESDPEGVANFEATMRLRDMVIISSNCPIIPSNYPIIPLNYPLIWPRNFLFHFHNTSSNAFLTPPYCPLAPPLTPSLTPLRTSVGTIVTCHPPSNSTSNPPSNTPSCPL